MVAGRCQAGGERFVGQDGEIDITIRTFPSAVAEVGFVDADVTDGDGDDQEAGYMACYDLRQP